MADIIQLLPDSIANQIAAGEVIQRPASVVKELLENAVDSGSNSIEVFLKEAGKTLIQVVDNGCGMSETDARMSFERHATSKIRSADDLFAIRTKGFRGEALASMAAIAQVVLMTKCLGEELGNEIIIEGAKIISQEFCQCNEGTSVSVKNLFFNIPARRNFLKSNKVEMRHIIEEFQRVAIAHPDIHFTLQHNNAELFHLKIGNLRQRIIGLFGNNYNERLVPVDESTDVVKIKGFIGKPEYARKTSAERFFMVNSRFVRNPYLHHAVMNAYDELLAEGNYPLYILFLDIDPAKIDINVHPTKQEIKFEDEKIIYSFLFAAIRRALSQHNITPTIDFNQEGNFDHLQSFQNIDNQMQPVHSSSGQTHQRSMLTGMERSNLKNWEKMFSDDKSTSVHTETVSSHDNKTTRVPETFSGEEDKKINIPFQIHNKYILAHIKSGYVLVDQQAAHERVLYERYLSRLKENKSPSQKQLFPQTINLNATDIEIVNEILPEIKALGFDIQKFGKNSLVVKGIPSDICSVNEQSVIEELVEQYKQNMREIKLEKRELIVMALARNTSIKEGQQLDYETRKTLLDELFACEVPNIAPNGRLTFITMSLDDLAKQFEKR